VRIDRYSPYFKAFTEYGWQSISPLPEYKGLHPQLSDTELAEVAYHFQGVGGVSTHAYLARLEASVEEWARRFANGEGYFIHPSNGLVQNEASSARRLKGGEVLTRILDCTHEINQIAKVLEQARCSAGTLESLAREGLLFLEDGQVLNLAGRVLNAP
jgi:hypothetical protein